MAKIDPWTRLLLGALWAMAGLATLSFTWSVVPLETLQHGVALLLLAALVHVLIRFRWSDRAVMLADLRVVYLVLGGSALLSLGFGLADGTLVAALSLRPVRGPLQQPQHAQHRLRPDHPAGLDGLPAVPAAGGTARHGAGRRAACCSPSPAPG